MFKPRIHSLIVRTLVIICIRPQMLVLWPWHQDCKILNFSHINYHHVWSLHSQDFRRWYTFFEPHHHSCLTNVDQHHDLWRFSNHDHRHQWTVMSHKWTNNHQSLDVSWYFQSHRCAVFTLSIIIVGKRALKRRSRRTRDIRPGATLRARCSVCSKGPGYTMATPMLWSLVQDR